MFNEDILVDRNALEEECSAAPAFFDYWQTQESNLKVDKENHKAKIGKEIRQMNDAELKEKHGISKLTEGAFNTLVESDSGYQRLKKLHLQAEASRKSYEKKLSMLDVLAKLHGQGYFAKIEGKSEVRTLLANTVKEKIRKEIRKRSAENAKPKRPK